MGILLFGGGGGIIFGRMGDSSRFELEVGREAYPTVRIGRMVSGLVAKRDG